MELLFVILRVKVIVGVGLVLRKTVFGDSSSSSSCFDKPTVSNPRPQGLSSSNPLEPLSLLNLIFTANLWIVFFMKERALSFRMENSVVPVGGIGFGKGSNFSFPLSSFSWK